ncbi:MAG TPA: diacylglycerol kinase [Actinocrinis sp.]|uniref:diacylglycerol kinase n=1 Tax=Actinocrinis sp. TaxID=1920516 RepID=UPI002DDD13D3|nr:diacylglycerol kinase [Actinocrinis sp.]HEV2347500.1 diacylglycerol kinase [Actinocrinis sp.]
MSAGEALALVVNPTSGKGRGRAYGDRARAVLTAAGLDVRFIVGRDADDAAKQARVALDDNAAALVVTGGDGMVSLGLQLVAGTGTPLGVIPAGTGNDVARFLGLPLRDPEAAARIVAAGRTGAFDLGRISGPGSLTPRWFGTVMACGLDSKVNERANRMRRPRGSSRYVLALLAELGPFRAIPFALDTDGTHAELNGMLVAVGNGPSYGGGMRICPQADVHDGRFQITVVDEVTKPTLLRIFPGVYSGRHVKHPKVRVQHAAEVALSSAPGQTVSIWADGEWAGVLPARIETVPGALLAYVPAP